MKDKHTINILGMSLTLVSEESDEYLNSLAAQIEERIKDMTMKSGRVTKMDAAMFCALDYLDLKIKAEERVGDAKKQFEDYERTIAELQAENSELRALLGK